MKKILYFNILVFLLCGWGMPVAAKQKKEEDRQKTEIKTPYQKFFEGKKKVTKEGWMKVHRINGKVYVEFPSVYLGKDMLFASSIENTSDNGEGVVGQFAGAGIVFRFIKRDSVIQANMIRNLPFDTGDNRYLTDLLQKSNCGSVYTSFKIEAINPTDSSYLIDMTPLFLESSYNTNPFSGFSGNSLFGFVSRIHNYKAERSFLKDIDAKAWNINVKCELSYNVDRLIFGAFLKDKDVPVTVTVNKMLTLLPENMMRPRLADPRIGVLPERKMNFSDSKDGAKQIYLAKRWRIEPVSESDYKQGKIVEPRQPIVFYLDSLMPEFWKPYVRAGVEAWNQAFERIGFKNVVRVKDFPVKDTTFDANDIRFSTIRFSPSVLWMTNIQTSLHEDPRSGEILNASIYIHQNLIYAMIKNRMVATMTADSSVRHVCLPDSEVGNMMKMHVMQAVGKCLGLAENLGASYAYPVDSLRSASFTREYGLSPSIMDDLVYNYIAQPEDVQKGVLLEPKGLGVYDFFAIKWLYEPIYGVQDFQEELTTLDRWIKESQQQPYCRFGSKQIGYPVYDPSVVRGDLGDDQVKALGYLLKNAKIAVQHLNEWYAENDENLQMRAELSQYLDGLLTGRIQDVANIIGGIYLRDVRNGDDKPSYEVIPYEKQRAAVKCLLQLTNEFSWLDDNKLMNELEIQNSRGDLMRQLVVSSLFARIKPVALCTEKSKEAYSIREYISDLYQWVWGKTLKNQKLTRNEMDVQRAFLTSVIQTSTVDASVSSFEPVGQVALVTPERNNLAARYCKTVLEQMVRDRAKMQQSGFSPIPMIQQNNYPVAHIYYKMLLDIQQLLKTRIQSSSGVTRQHYDYLLFKIRRALELK